MDDIDFKDRDLVIWGAGNTTILCQGSFNNYGLDPIFYVDKDEKKQKCMFYGRKVLPPDALNNIDKPIVLISSANIGFTDEIKMKLNQMDLTHLTIDEYFFGKNADRLIRAADMLFDDRSVEVYCDMVLNRLNNRVPDDDTVSEDPYFVLPVFRKVVAGDVFVNAGAYKGEEIERYIECCNGKTFGKIISFEPDSANYMEMLTLVDRLNERWNIEEDKIQSVMAALGDVTKTSFLNSGKGLASSVDEIASDDSSSINVHSLDDFVHDGRVDLIKADIESFELKMLRGAEKLIIRNVPKIAVCIYHSPVDFFEIIEYLSDLDVGYRFSVRHHSKQLLDTVLYAYTEPE